MTHNALLPRFAGLANKILIRRDDVASISLTNSYHKSSDGRFAEIHLLDYDGADDVNSDPEAQSLFRQAPHLFDIIDIDRAHMPKIIFFASRSHVGIFVESIASMEGCAEAQIIWQAGEPVRWDNGSHILLIYPADAEELSGHEVLALRSNRTLGDIRSFNDFAYLFAADSGLFDTFHHDVATLPDSCPVEFLDFCRESKDFRTEARILVRTPPGAILRLKDKSF